MGRALFSETYGYKAPAIRVQSESIPADPARWSLSNPFDPDSDDFFQGAEYEAFMDVGEVDRLEHPVVVSDSSSDSSDSGRDSPLEDTSEPVHVVWFPMPGQSPSSVTYHPVVDEATGEVSHARTLPGTDDDAVTIRATAEPERVRPVSVLPPSSLRNSTTATDLERANATGGLSPRRVSVPPITIPVARSTSSPASPSSASPTTPPAVYSAHMHFMSPSPPPTVSPRIYVWGGAVRTPASPGSPSVRHTYSHSAAGPLTNPGARQSLARITPRRRAQNV
ncbi:hypothetical protein MSAN_00681200 [Mycena sanguinolenta]|uniref:Uncharacterized protein n=1 Tax=Mycena sanguinolenta TaxID=230812 RepID=A0A8H7DCJ9_9AGAR|nr:hypothetical protein MSAN_00681200 [Mycena sanguinolenta]